MAPINTIMRKIFSLFLLLSVVTLQARQILPGEAAAIASEFLNSSSTRLKATKSGDVKRVMAKTAAVDNEAQPYYVFNGDNDGGFVIISGDDRARKILGYSDTGNFDYDNIPPQLADLLDQYVKQIEALPASATTDPSWRKASRAATDDEGVLLETANWGQGYPYNLQTPIIEGEHCPTGCVATAMAIVMKYHNWPESYNWDAMPISQLETPVESLSKLMADAGDAVLMNYTPYESGAHMNWVGHRLQQTFKYSPECQYITRANFSDEEWVSMLRGNLDSNEPVIYNGSGTGNHAFIIDGYDNDTYHINWGWDGMCNGYFDLDALKPNESQDFSSNCGMVINIVPDRSGMEYSECFVDYGYFWANKGHGLTTNSITNTPADFALGIFQAPKGTKGDVALALMDKDGELKEILQINTYDVTYPNADFLEGRNLNFINILPSTKVNDEDIITLLTRDAGTQKWLKVLGTLEAPCEKTVGSIIPKSIKVTFEFDESEFKTTYWKGYNDDCHHEVKNGESVDFAYGLSNIQLIILDDQGYSSYPEDKILIRIENEATGTIDREWQSSWVAFDCVNDLVIHIISLKAENKESIYVETPGSLETLCTKIDPQRTGELHIEGNINAKDLWYIRDNFINLVSLDLSEVAISACNEMDPKYPYELEVRGEYPANTLPANGLHGLSKLSYLGLPDDLQGIQTESCSGLSLSAIELPKSLSVIEPFAFNLNYNLSTVICKSLLPPTISDDTFTNTNIPVASILICPDGSLQAYSSNNDWDNLFSEIICDSNIGISDLTKEKDGVVYDLIPFGSKITGYIQESINREGIIIPDIIKFGNTNRKVVEIAENAFYYCLTKEIVLSNNIEKIGSSAFSMTSETESIILPTNLKEIPANMCSGSRIKDIIIPESVELLSSAFDGCIYLEHLYIPQKANGTAFFRNMIGSSFQSMIEFDVHPNNSTWCAIDGLLYSKDKSTLFNCPGTKTGILDVCKETTIIENLAFDRCSNLSKIRFSSDQIHIGYASMNLGYTNMDNIEFPQNTYFSGTQSLCVYGIRSLTLGDFTVSIIDGVQCFPAENQKLKVYLKNQNAVEFSETYMTGCSDWEYYITGLTNNVTVPKKSQLYVPGGTKEIFNIGSDISISEMWKYKIDKVNGKVKIEPLIDGLVIDDVVINGTHNEVNTNNIYEYDNENATDLDIVVEFTLHERQQMTTHYNAEFNAAVPSTDLSPVSEIVLSSDNETLFIGKTAQLTATVLPENAANKTLVWTSSDENVATVDADGKVTAVSLGEAVITATATDGSGISVTCTVTVVPTPAESIALNHESAQLKIGESVALEATVLPENATDKTVTWSSSDEAVATVDADGNVTAVSLGEATVTATCGSVSATCAVTVIPTLAESIVISQETATLKVGETVELTATVLPKDATDKTVTWSSSDEAVATVDADGNVTAVSLGEATVTATCGSVSATCAVTVIPTLAESLTIDPESWDGVEDETFQITAEILPENTTDKTLNWSSSDETVATVDADGLVSVLRDGTCRITVATTDGSNLTAECIVTGRSGIDTIFANGDERFDVYNMQGALIVLDGRRDDLKKLSPGMYVLRQGTKVIKVFIH